MQFGCVSGESRMSGVSGLPHHFSAVSGSFLVVAPDRVRIVFVVALLVLLDACFHIN